jgi:hypothetical protein
MENENPSSEDMDPEFLKELNSLTKQLKTDEEIQKDLKKNKESSDKKENEIKENNINQNPFNEAFDKMNLNNFYNNENNDLIFESLDNLNSQVNQFNFLLNKSIDLNKNNNKDKETENKNEINEKQNNLLKEILDFLIQSNLLKDTILNMKKLVEESFEKNKNKLKPEEKNKYEEVLINTNIIINEVDKLNPDRDKIMDSLEKLQQISNDIDYTLPI